jgi:hypothetical protein
MTLCVAARCCGIGANALVLSGGLTGEDNDVFSLLTGEINVLVNDSFVGARQAVSRVKGCC